MNKEINIQDANFEKWDGEMDPEDGQNKMLQRNRFMMNIRNQEEVKGSVKGKKNCVLLLIKHLPQKWMYCHNA